jgi:hypothetical protein
MKRIVVLLTLILSLAAVAHAEMQRVFTTCVAGSEDDVITDTLCGAMARIIDHSPDYSPTRDMERPFVGLHIYTEKLSGATIASVTITRGEQHIEVWLTNRIYAVYNASKIADQILRDVDSEVKGTTWRTQCFSTPDGNR